MMGFPFRFPIAVTSAGSGTAYDGEKRVVVIVTHQAERDHGLARIQEAARAKYANDRT